MSETFKPVPMMQGRPPRTSGFTGDEIDALDCFHEDEPFVPVAMTDYSVSNVFGVHVSSTDRAAWLTYRQFFTPAHQLVLE